MSDVMKSASKVIWFLQ